MLQLNKCHNGLMNLSTQLVSLFAYSTITISYDYSPMSCRASKAFRFPAIPVTTYGTYSLIVP